MDDLIRTSLLLDTSLETIKSDLIQLRNEDIRLMKQLIQISETIQQISKRQMQQRPSFNAKGYLNRVLMFVNQSSVSIRVDTPLIRRQSVPTYCRMKEYYSASLSSVEDDTCTTSTNGDSTLNETSTDEINHEINIVNRQVSLPVPWQRPKSVSNLSYSKKNYITDSDRYLEDILMRNVKVWKRTQQVDNDSVFLEDDTLMTFDK